MSGCAKRFVISRRRASVLASVVTVPAIHWRLRDLTLESTPTLISTLMTDMTVSELGRRTGTTADTIRYYERIGLLSDVARSPAGYRLFTNSDVDRMGFIRRAQRFGLQLDQIGELLGVRDRGLCPCGHARELLTGKLEELDEQLESLSRLRADIERLLDNDSASEADEVWPCGSGFIEIGARPKEDRQ